MRLSICLAVACVTLAGCAGDGGGPQNIQLERGSGSYQAPPAAGPHQLSAAERSSVQTTLAGTNPGAVLAQASAYRSQDGVVSVCGTATNAGQTMPFLGTLMSSGGKPGFALAGLAYTPPEALAVRKICSERKITI